MESKDTDLHEELMALALDEARLAGQEGEVPVGCVVYHDGEVIGAAHNKREADQNPLAHAELLAISAAAQRLGGWRLVDCLLAVTLEPCVMCAGAIINSRIPHVIYGASDPKAGACESLYSVGEDRRLNHRFSTTSGVAETECAEMLSAFFKHLRSGESA